MDKKIPVKTIRIELGGEYEGWWFDVRTNPPVGILLDRIAKFEEADKSDLREFASAVYELMELMLCGWNFVDEQGKDLPASLEGMKGISLDLLMLMADKVPTVIAEAVEVPKALDGG